jgi:hypothetical protein
MTPRPNGYAIRREQRQRVSSHGSNADALTALTRFRIRIPFGAGRRADADALTALTLSPTHSVRGVSVMARPSLPVGTRTTDVDGYVREKRPDHPLAQAGWVRLHRAVLYDALGPGEHPCWRCGTPVAWGAGLEPDHIDRDRLDNQLANLRPACRACQNRHRRIGLRKNRPRP